MRRPIRTITPIQKHQIRIEQPRETRDERVIRDEARPLGARPLSEARADSITDRHQVRLRFFDKNAVTAKFVNLIPNPRRTIYA